MSFATIILCVTFQQVFIVVVDFVINSVWKLLDTLLYMQQISARPPAWHLSVSLLVHWFNLG